MNTISNERTPVQKIKSLQDPPVARALFNDVHWAWIWLLLRLYLGWEWLQAGWGK